MPVRQLVIDVRSWFFMCCKSWHIKILKKWLLLLFGGDDWKNGYFWPSDIMRFYYFLVRVHKECTIPSSQLGNGNSWCNSFKSFPAAP